jgi:hypothetical protein
MAQDDPKPKRRGWRDIGGDKPREAPVGRGWQRLNKADDVGKRKPWSRESKLVVAGMLLGVVLGLFAWVISWIAPLQPAGILMAGSGYHTNLLVPPNVLGWQGLQEIKSWSEDSANREKWFFFRDTGTRLWPASGSESFIDLKSIEDWGRVIKGIESDRNGTLVVYLSVQGGSDANGGYILVNDETNLTNIKLPLKEKVFPELKDAVSRHRNTVLVFDVALVETDGSVFVGVADELVPFAGAIRRSLASGTGDRFHVRVERTQAVRA